jgi:hypothetical protein
MAMVIIVIDVVMVISVVFVNIVINVVLVILVYLVNMLKTTTRDTKCVVKTNVPAGAKKSIKKVVEKKKVKGRKCKC